MITLFHADSASCWSWKIRDDHAVPRGFGELLVLEKRPIPVQREPLPHREARRIEAENGQNHQRQMQKEVNRGGVQTQPALHTSPSRSLRSISSTSTPTSAISPTEMAAPKGQSRALVNWFCTRLPISTVRPPPNRSGVR